MLLCHLYFQARNLPIDKLRPTYLIINGAVYLVQVSHFKNLTVIRYCKAKMTHRNSYLLQVVVWVYAGTGTNPVAIEIAELFFAGDWICSSFF